MSVVICQSPCGGCGRVFAFHPNFVPSYHGQVFCAGCMALVNAKRRERGLDPFPVHPLAYEVADETEINWDGKPRTVYPVKEEP